MHKLSHIGFTILMCVSAWTLSSVYLQSGWPKIMNTSDSSSVLKSNISAYYLGISYLGKSDVFDEAVSRFAMEYAEQNKRDYEELERAAKTGKIVSA